MSTLTLGIVVIIYMFILAWLGYIGYKQTKNASDYLLGGRPIITLHRGTLSIPPRPQRGSDQTAASLNGVLQFIKTK